MTKRAVTAIVLTTALAGLLTGCASSKKGSGDNVASALDVPTDAAGESPLAGVVRIVDIDRSTMNTDGTVRYYVENQTGKFVENLVFTVQFSYPPDPNKERNRFSLPYEAVGTPEQFINLQPSDTRKEILAVCPEFEARAAMGQLIQSTKLTVFEDAPALPVARSADGRGSEFVGGALELVGIADAELYDTPPTFWIELENISSRVVDAEVQVIFLELDGKTVSGQTSWQGLGAMRPGQTTHTNINLAGAGRVKGKGFWIKIRPVGF